MRPRRETHTQRERERERERNREKETGGENVSERKGKRPETERRRENGRGAQGGGKSRADRRIWYGIYVRGEKGQKKKDHKSKTKHEDVRNTH
jgi:hypothetical protein